MDSARGLEYIHEHTTPAYIHRDIKSANILIDKDFRAKVVSPGPSCMMNHVKNLQIFGLNCLFCRLQILV